jgi:hypothetical protein
MSQSVSRRSYYARKRILVAERGKVKGLASQKSSEKCINEKVLTHATKESIRRASDAGSCLKPVDEVLIRVRQLHIQDLQDKNNFKARLPRTFGIPSTHHKSMIEKR